MNGTTGGNFAGVWWSKSLRQSACDERLDELELDVSELKESVKRALDKLLPKVDALLTDREQDICSADVVNGGSERVQSAATIFQAAENGDAQTLMKMLADGAEVRQRNECGYTVLHLAAIAGHEHVVMAILGNCPVDMLGRRGQTALHCASAQGHVKVVRRLLKAGAQIDVTDSDGNFALLIAAKAGHLGVVEDLINNNASLDAHDNEGNSAMVAAAMTRKWDVVDFLLRKGASVKQFNEDDDHPFQIVAKSRNYPLILLMLKQMEKSIDVENEMQIALVGVDDPYLPWVFEDFIPGFSRRERGLWAMEQLVEEVKLDTLGAMLDVGGDINGLTPNGYSCLMTASFYGKEDAVKYLLEKGASVDLQDDNGFTALHYAAQEGSIECVRELLAAGASKDIENISGFLPIEISEEEEILRLLK